MPWTVYSRREATSAAARVLITSPQLSDAALAELAGVGSTTIGSTRVRLEQVGVIPRVPVADRTARPRPRHDSRTAAAIAAGCTTPRQIADAAGVSLQAAYKALQRTRPRLADAAAAVDSLSVVRDTPEFTDVAGSTEAISVVVTITCAQCTAAFTVSTADAQRRHNRFCSDPCRDADSRAQGRQTRPRQADGTRYMHQVPIPDFPPPPDWSRGVCAHVPKSQQGWWTSRDPVLREAAANLCETCPILAPCAEFSLAMPVTDSAVWAGQTQAERLRRKRAAAAQDKPYPRIR